MNGFRCSCLSEQKGGMVHQVAGHRNKLLDIDSARHELEAEAKHLTKAVLPDWKDVDSDDIKVDFPTSLSVSHRLLIMSECNRIRTVLIIYSEDLVNETLFTEPTWSSHLSDAVCIWFWFWFLVPFRLFLLIVTPLTCCSIHWGLIPLHSICRLHRFVSLSIGFTGSLRCTSGRLICFPTIIARRHSSFY